jgi:transposase-like protein
LITLRSASIIVFVSYSSGLSLPAPAYCDRTSGANTAAIGDYNADHEFAIELRQVKYLNNIGEQDHRAIKRITRPMLAFKTNRCARILVAGIETMHMTRKGQLNCPKGMAASAAAQFYSLAF